MAFNPENITGGNPPENKPPLSFADYVANYKKTQETAEAKHQALLHEKGLFQNNTDLAKIEIPDFGKQILDEIDDVKKRLADRKTLYANGEKTFELDMKDSEWLGNATRFIRENSDNPDVIAKFWRKYDARFKDVFEKKGNNFANVCKNSILGTAATFEELEKEFGLKIEPADSLKDTKYKIDASAETRDEEGRNIFFAIQCYSINSKGLLPEDQIFLSDNGMIQPFDEQDLDTKWKGHAQTVFAKELEEKINKTKVGCKEYIMNYEQKLRDSKIVLLFITMPMGVDHDKPIIDETGHIRNKNTKRYFDGQMKYVLEQLHCAGTQNT